MELYMVQSLETHLFFGRIMKEHALFLEAAFPSKEIRWIKRTQRLQGLSGRSMHCEMRRKIRELNQRALRLLSGLIRLKEEILAEVLSCNLFTANYPLLIQHILREAKLYQSFMFHLERTGMLCTRDMQELEVFWNRIMMEHALFIRGLLDPAEEELIKTADEFSREYAVLLEATKEADARSMEALTEKTREETVKYRDFKTAGAKGINGCEITSVILPLLADHVLREANHYLRILKG